MKDSLRPRLSAVLPPTHTCNTSSHGPKGLLNFALHLEWRSKPSRSHRPLHHSDFASQLLATASPKDTELEAALELEGAPDSENSMFMLSSPEEKDDNGWSSVCCE